MSSRRLTIEGELHLTLEDAAECYELELTWVRHVYAEGLLGPGHPQGPTAAIPARRLDRLARIVRLHRHLGFELGAVEALLGPEE